MIRKDKFYNRKKAYIGKVIAISMILLSSFTFPALADDPGEPCDENDPIGNCPIDAWVIPLTVTTACFGAYYLSGKKNKNNLFIPTPQKT